MEVNECIRRPKLKRSGSMTVNVHLSVSDIMYSLATSLSHTFDSVQVDDMPVRGLGSHFQSSSSSDNVTKCR